MNKYERSEYEYNRSKAKKELERKKKQINIFIEKTYSLLKTLGLSDDEIYNYYKLEKGFK